MFNNNGPIVPPMKDVLGDSYAETRTEIEARERAKQAADAAQLAANEQAAQKKFPWLALLAILFGFATVIAVAVIFLKQTEYDKLKQELDTVTSSYNSALQNVETLEKENKTLKAQVEALTPKTNPDEVDPENGTAPEADTKSGTGTETDAKTDSQSGTDTKNDSSTTKE